MVAGYLVSKHMNKPKKLTWHVCSSNFVLKLKLSLFKSYLFRTLIADLESRVSRHGIKSIIPALGLNFHNNIPARFENRTLETRHGIKSIIPALGLNFHNNIPARFENRILERESCF